MPAIKYLLLLLLTGIGLAVKAQFNDTTHYRASYNSAGSINKADNGSSYLLNNGLMFEVKKQDMLLNSTNTWVYGRSNGSLTNNDYSSYLNFDLYKTFPHFYYWGLANYNTSYSLKINNQLLAGLGVAYKILDRKNASLNLSDGVLYDRSDLFLNDTTHDDYHAYRNSLRLQFRFIIRNLLTISSSDFLQNSFSRGSDYIIRSNISFAFKLNKWLSLTSALVYNRMNRTRSENTLFTYGLTADRYF